MTHINTIFKKYINNGCGSFDNPVPGRLYVQFKGYFIKPAVKFLSLNIVVARILAKVGVVLRTLGSHVRLVEFWWHGRMLRLPIAMTSWSLSLTMMESSTRVARWRWWWWCHGTADGWWWHRGTAEGWWSHGTAEGWWNWGKNSMRWQRRLFWLPRGMSLLSLQSMELFQRL